MNALKKKQRDLLDQEREKTGDLEKRLAERLDRLNEKLNPALEKLKTIMPTLPQVKKLS